MPLAAEVHAFEGEIGGDQGLRAGEGGEQGAVVSDGLEDAARSRAAQDGEGRLAGLRDAFDETVFRDRHERTEYSEMRAEEKRNGVEVVVVQFEIGTTIPRSSGLPCHPRLCDSSNSGSFAFPGIATSIPARY